MVNRIFQAYFCSICESLLLTSNGFYCDCCGVCADHECIKQADKKFKCKDISLMLNKEEMKHHWIRGDYLW